MKSDQYLGRDYPSDFTVGEQDNISRPLITRWDRSTNEEFVVGTVNEDLRCVSPNKLKSYKHTTVYFRRSGRVTSDVVKSTLFEYLKYFLSNEETGICSCIISARDIIEDENKWRQFPSAYYDLGMLSNDEITFYNRDIDHSNNPPLLYAGKRKGDKEEFYIEQFAYGETSV